MQWPTPALPDCEFKDPQKIPLEKVINRGMLTPLRAPTHLSKQSDWPVSSPSQRLSRETHTILYTRRDYKVLDIFIAVGKYHFAFPGFNLTDLCLGFRLPTGATSLTGGRAGAKAPC